MIKCNNCGDVSHVTMDCPYKNNKELMELAKGKNWGSFD